MAVPSITTKRLVFLVELGPKIWNSVIRLEIFNVNFYFLQLS